MSKKIRYFYVWASRSSAGSLRYDKKKVGHSPPDNIRWGPLRFCPVYCKYKLCSSGSMYLLNGERFF